MNARDETLDTFEAQRDRLTAKLDAIRVVHFTEIGNEYGATECGVCRETTPCQTVAIIDEAEGAPDLVGVVLAKLVALQTLADQLEADANSEAANAIREILYRPTGAAEGGEQR